MWILKVLIGVIVLDAFGGTSQLRRFIKKELEDPMDSLKVWVFGGGFFLFLLFFIWLCFQY